MTMKTKFYLMALLATAAVSACKKNQVPDTTRPEAAININTSIDALTKAPQLDGDGKGSFSQGDVFTLAVSSGNTSESQEFDYTVGTSQLYWKDVTLTPSDGKVVFSACYPTQTLSGGAFVFDLAEAGYKDLLLSRVPGIELGTESTVVLPFRHAMHRLVMNYTVEDGLDLSDWEIETSCNAISSCTVDLLTGALEENTSSRSSFTAKGKSAEFILIPQNASDLSFEVKAGDIDRTFTLDELDQNVTSLEGGHQLTVNMVIKDGKIIFGDSVIEGWGDQGTIGGEIIL